MSDTRLLLCTDMDRTIIPNGAQPEHPLARARFAKFCSRPEVTLAYVTGRHLELVESAIQQYELPQPDFAITDVGSKIYHYQNNQWQDFTQWELEIDQDWHGYSHTQIKKLLTPVVELKIQESENQNKHKLSYYLPLDTDKDAVLNEIHNRLQQHQVLASLIWSIDEEKNIGLLDVLPLHATKLHAVQFLQQHLGFSHNEVIFAGDSGNDLPVLVSEINSILVNNASQEIKNTASQLAQQKGHSDALYIADDHETDTDGNYSAGVLQGIRHYAPFFAD